jgi:hypothetical protein
LKKVIDFSDYVFDRINGTVGHFWAGFWLIFDDMRFINGVNHMKVWDTFR